LMKRTNSGLPRYAVCSNFLSVIFLSAPII
jgi:hypothetical protein